MRTRLKIKAPSRLLAAILLTISAGLILATMDAVGKHLSESLNVLQAVWARYTVHTVVITILLYRLSGFRFLKTKRPVAQTVRAASLFIATVFMYTSITLVPLADATAIQFLAPVLVTVWSVIFLREKIGIHRIVAVLAAFGGVLIIVSPGIQLDTPALFLPLVTAFFASIYFILTRVLAGADERECTQFSTTAVGALVLTLGLPFFWQTPGVMDVVLMVVIGLIGLLGHYLLIKAFALETASLLSPFLYSQVFGATLLSVFWFGDALSIYMAFGTTILICSGLYIWWRENRRLLEAKRLIALSEDEEKPG